MNAYQTHQPLLFACAALAIETGEIIELGCGLHSTPQLAAMCAVANAAFHSYETNREWATCLMGLVKGVRHVESYDDVPLRPCAMVFIDNDPEDRRKVDVARFAGVARLVVIHDSDAKYGEMYGLEESLALYPHRFDYTPMSPNTAVVSRDARAIRRIREAFEVY